MATLEKDGTANTEEALLEVYRKLRPGEPPTVDSAQSHIDSLFFDPRRYDLSKVGRYKYNKKLAITPRILGRTTSRPVADPLTGELLAGADTVLTRELAERIGRAGVDKMCIRDRGSGTAGRSRYQRNSQTIPNA